MNKLKKLLALLLCAAMTVAVVPAFALAEEQAEPTQIGVKEASPELTPRTDLAQLDQEAERSIDATDIESIETPDEVELMAAEISTEDLFKKYPAYLSNKDVQGRLAVFQSDCYDVINEFNGKRTGVAVFMQSLSDGLSVCFRDLLGSFGLTETYGDSLIKESARKFLDKALESDKVLSSGAKKCRRA